MSYTFTLLIDPTVLSIQPQSSDNLCIAKKVNGKFTTVFQDAAIKPKRTGQKTLLLSNNFTWEDKYRVFATVSYKHGMLVSSATNTQPLAFGEETSYSSNVFTAAKIASTKDFINESGPQSPADSFLAKKIPSPLHVAVELQSGGIWVPIYVDPEPHTTEMDHQLTPLNEYMVFWSSSVQTASMIDESRCSQPMTFSYEGNVKAQTVRFGYRSADNAGPGEQPTFYTK